MSSARWHIGTIRPEEARIHDTWAGYHSFHSEPEDPQDLSTRSEYGSFEIFWHAGGSLWHEEEPEGEPDAPGWYWAAGFPGCLWDGEPSGPFATSRDALEDADEWHPEFDE